MASAKMLNRARILAKLRAAAPSVIQEVEAQLNLEAIELAAAVKRAVPKRTGTMAETVRVEPGDRPMSLKVVVGGVPATRKKVRQGVKKADFEKARQEGGFQGEYDYPMGVELGHRAVDGSHVPAEPFFWPTYRARKKGMRRRMSAAGRRGLKNFDLDKTRG